MPGAVAIAEPAPAENAVAEDVDGPNARAKFREPLGQVVRIKNTFIEGYASDDSDEEDELPMVAAKSCPVHAPQRRSAELLGEPWKVVLGEESPLDDEEDGPSFSCSTRTVEDVAAARRGMDIGAEDAQAGPTEPAAVPVSVPAQVTASRSSGRAATVAMGAPATAPAAQAGCIRTSSRAATAPAFPSSAAPALAALAAAAAGPGLLGPGGDVVTPLPLRRPEPSLGAALHQAQTCKPCAWFWKPQGCVNGRSCCHCHQCPPGEGKARRKNKIASLRSSSGGAGALSTTGPLGSFVTQGGPQLPAAADVAALANSLGGDLVNANRLLGLPVDAGGQYALSIASVVEQTRSLQRLLEQGVGMLPAQPTAHGASRGFQNPHPTALRGAPRREGAQNEGAAARAHFDHRSWLVAENPKYILQ